MITLMFLCVFFFFIAFCKDNQDSDGADGVFEGTVALLNQHVV